MLNGGKSSADWDNLPISDIKLLTVDYFAKEERWRMVMASAIRQAFSKKDMQEMN